MSWNVYMNKFYYNNLKLPLLLNATYNIVYFNMYNNYNVHQRKYKNVKFFYFLRLIIFTKIHNIRYLYFRYFYFCVTEWWIEDEAHHSPLLYKTSVTASNSGAYGCNNKYIQQNKM